MLKESMTAIGAAILIAGCGETEEEINANNAKSRAAVETASANNNIKSTGFSMVGKYSVPQYGTPRICIR